MSQADPEANQWSSFELVPLEASSGAVAPELVQPAGEKSLVSIRPLNADAAELEAHTFELQQRNQELAAALAEAQARLQQQQQHHEAMVGSERQLLQQVSQLNHDLEQNQQAFHRIKILNQSLSDQLRTAQERISELENQYAQAQQYLSEQTHSLHQYELTCQDLQSRLQRQQRHTLQFKAALERCLEVPGSPVAQASLTPGAQPIQPWSTVDSPNLDPRLLEMKEAVSTVSSLSSEPEPLLPFPQALPQPFKETAGQARPVVQPVVRPVEPTPEPGFSKSRQPESRKLDSWQPKTTQPELRQPLDTGRKPEPVASSPNTPSPNVRSDARSDPGNASPANPPANLEDTANAPSPLIYPERRQRGLKSLAAVDLPSFPRYQKPEPQ
ncbi:hypothetical protein [Leptolyngbya sp. FACHB-261]|uniref:hypothetical protein n=1 Tax=Leptolyngbya sp. FACHB-261 TaxID=2692806 RepID=UPI001683507B|nr:hypothetical protein [Leptolyngbya sp. FACHB-261]MBD2103424.1 hypothetical protein [Leptolyngbya sp. FACHB-261]